MTKTYNMSISVSKKAHKNNLDNLEKLRSLKPNKNIEVSND